MTSKARKEQRRAPSGERPSVRLAAAPPIDIGEAAERARKPRYVNRPAKPTGEGYVTLGFRGTEEDDEIIRKAVETGGYYSKADLIRKATMALAEKEIGDEGARELEISEAAHKLGIDLDAFKEQMLAELVKKAKKTK